MNDTRECRQATGKPNGADRLEYRAPQLIEFGNLATRTLHSRSTGVEDNGLGFLNRSAM